jgi:hypothetical protein
MSTADARGDLVARILSTSWRAAPPSADLTPGEVAEVAPALLATGSAALGWWRLASGTDPKGDAGRALHDAFRLQTLDARLHERRLLRVVQILTDAGVDFVVAKGWAVARLYGQPGLRPYGDIDVFVSPPHHGRAGAVLAAHEGESLRVDLHAGVPLLHRLWPEIALHVERNPVNGASVPVLGPEDHLGLLSVHLFFHGAWRPTWLCDIAAFVEGLPGSFRWERLDAWPRRQRELVRAAVLLAADVLGADAGKTPWVNGESLPRWLPEAVRRSWGAGGHYSVTTRIGLTEPRPEQLFEAVRVRWPNPIEATFRWHAPINGFPRLPFQLMDVAARGVKLLVGR